MLGGGIWKTICSFLLSLLLFAEVLRWWTAEGRNRVGGTRTNGPQAAHDNEHQDPPPYLLDRL